MGTTRAEAMAAWQEGKETRRQAAREAGQGDRPSGFRVRAWRRAGVFGAEAVQRVERLLTDLLKAVPGDSDADATVAAARVVVRTNLEGEPTPQLVGAVHALLCEASPEHVAQTLLAIHAAHLPWLSPLGTQRLEALVDPSCPPLAVAVRPSLSEDPAGAFALHAALCSGDLGELSDRTMQRIVHWAPLAVLDELIDLGRVTAAYAPWRYRPDADDDERAYLRARLEPEAVEEMQARALGWREAVEHHAFLAGRVEELTPGGCYDLLRRAGEGDSAVLDELEANLTRDAVLELRAVKGGALSGNWPTRMLQDRSLWRLLAALWEPSVPINPARGPFYAYRALCYAHTLILRRDFTKAAAQLERFQDVEVAAEMKREINTMHAYVALQGDDLGRCVELLASVGEDFPAGRANRDLILARVSTLRNERQHPSNPYLELGLPHYHPDWKSRYRELRRASRRLADESAERAEVARLNRAMKRIEEATRADDWSGFFVLPLDPGVLTPSAAPLAVLAPVLPPLVRRTALDDADALRTVRDRALPGLLDTFLAAPRRPDHQI